MGTETSVTPEQRINNALSLPQTRETEVITKQTELLAIINNENRTPAERVAWETNSQRVGVSLLNIYILTTGFTNSPPPSVPHALALYYNNRPSDARALFSTIRWTPPLILWGNSRGGRSLEVERSNSTPAPTPPPPATSKTTPSLPPTPPPPATDIERLREVINDSRTARLGNNSEGVKAKLFIAQASIGLMKAGLNEIYHDGANNRTESRLVNYSRSLSLGLNSTDRGTSERRAISLIDNIFGWTDGTVGIHFQTAETRSGTESNQRTRQRDQILRLCQVIIDYKEENKLSDEELATKLGLELNETKDILFCRIEQFSVEYLKNIILNNKLLTESEVDYILQEENNITTLQKARENLQDEVEILRKRLENETKNLPASLPTQEDREQLKSFLTNYRNIVEKVNTNQKDSIEIQNNEPEYEAKIEQLITKIDNWK